jgi:hypothetical protein
MPEPLGKITTYSNVISTRYNPDEFVGREWLIKEVARFRDDQDRRHMVIVGEPGSGKSTFLAYLAESWNCPRHFIRVDNISGVTGVDPRAFLVSLGSQLYQKYGPHIFEQRISSTTKVMVGWAKDQKEIVGRFVEELYTLPFLPLQRDDIEVKVGIATGQSQVIGERIKRLVDVTLKLDELTLLHVTLINPLQKIQEVYPTEKVVILIDALDESLHHAGRKILDVIPQATDAEFPANLRLIMTSRRGEHLSKFRPDDLLYLDDEKKGYRQASQKDIREYIDKRLSEDPLAGTIASWEQEEVDAYIAQLQEHSLDNFLCLYYFFNELASHAEITQIDLQSFRIPKGLDQVYRAFALEKIRRNMESTIRITITGEISASLLAQLKTIPNVFQVAVIDQDVLLTTTDSDQVTQSLFHLLYSTEIQFINFQTQKAEQLGTWEEKYLPILGVLAVAYEPLHREQIAEFARVEIIYVDSVIGRLKQFLDEVMYEQTNAYQFYHLSFRDYLLDSQRNREYPLDGPKYHYQIASYYREGRATWAEVDWGAITDSYPFNHLVAHLEASGHSEELHRLLALETKQHRNIWYEVKETRGDMAGYLADVRGAWHLAESAYIPTDTTRTGRNTSLQCRYALIVSSLNSLVQNIPPELLHFLVKQGVWTARPAMTYARQVPDVLRRAKAMAELLPFIDQTRQEEWFREAFTAVQVVDDENDRVEVLLKLVSLYPEPKPEGVLRNILDLIPWLKEAHQTKVLMEVEPYLSKALLDDALVIERQSGGNAIPLAALAHRLPERQRQEVFEEILATVSKPGDLLDREAAFLALARYQSSPELDALLQDILTAARAGLSEKDEDLRILSQYALMDLMPYLPRPEQERALQELLPSIETVKFNRGTLLIYLVSQLPLSLRTEVLSVARKTGNKISRINLLADLTPYFEGEQRDELLKEVVEAARTSTGGMWLADEVGKLALYMTPELLQEALDIARQVWKDRWKVRALVGLSVPLSGREREIVLKEALETALTFRNVDDLKKSVALLAPFLTIPLLREALATGQAINDSDSLIDGLPELFSRLPDSGREQAWRLGLDATPGLHQEWKRQKLVADLVPNLSEGLLIEALIIIRGFEQPGLRIEGLAALAPFLPEPQRQMILEEALSAVEEPFSSVKVNDIAYRAEHLISLIPQLTLSKREKVIQQALNEVNRIDDIEREAPILVQLIPFLPSSEGERVIQSTLEKPARFHRGRRVLQTLAPQLPEKIVRHILHDLRRKYLPRARWLKLYSQLPRPLTKLGFVIDDHEEDGVCSALVARLAQLGDPTTAYEIVMERAKQSQQFFEPGLLALTPHLPESLAREALTVALRLPDSTTRESVLSQLCTRIAELGRGQDVLSHAQNIKNPFWRANALRAIASHIHEGVQDSVWREMLAATQQIEDTKEYSKMIATLSPQLATWPLSPLHAVWRDIIPRLASGTRQYLVPNLCCLTPVLATLGGKEAPVELLHAIEDVYRWWP